MTALSTLRRALRLARRDLRGGFRGLGVFLGCIALGVGAIAGVGSLSASVLGGLHGNARVLLGGDIELRRTHRGLDAEMRAWIEDRGAHIGDSVQMRAMAVPPDGGGRTLVELKAVAPDYPLFGAVTLEPPLALADALAEGGAVAEKTLLDRLGVSLGDTLTIGDSAFVLRAVITKEPDRLATVFSFGPRLMIAEANLAATGLVQPGSLIRYYHRLALPPDARIADWVDDLDAAFPDADWHMRDARNAQPGFQRFVERLSLYLSLIGLTALLVGGIGIAGAVRAHLETRTETIAIFKCIGARYRDVFLIYLIQVMALALPGIAIGLVGGAALPVLLGPLLGERLPVDPAAGFYPAPLAAAAAIGLLTALAFTLWPLARAGDTAPAGLFRQSVDPTRRWPRPTVLACLALVAAILAVFAVETAGDRVIGAGFVAAALVTLAIFRGVGLVLVRVVRRFGRTRRRLLRLALANLGRPDAPTGHAALSLGVGLTVLIAIGLVEGNISLQVTERLPEKAPAFFFIDIQPDQIDPFMQLVEDTPGASDPEQVPMMRGRIVELNGEPVSAHDIDPSVRWMTHSDIGITFADRPPERTSITAGDWWPAEYQGPPLVSFDEAGARGMGLDIGDTLTLSVLGRRIEARIASLRRIDWRDFGINFLVILDPDAMRGAPHSHVATVRAAPDAEARLVAAVGERFSNVSAIPVRAMLLALNDIVAAVATALRGTAGVTLLAGMLVLAGVVAADRQRRIYDSTILKVLGATRADLLKAYALEFGLLGLIAGAVAALLGTVGAWLFITQVLDDVWVFLPIRVASVVVLGIVVAAAIGFLGTWRALGHKPMAVLRTE